MIELSNATCSEQHRTELANQRLRVGRGMTLVEMLVAMAASLIMLALVAQLMAMFGKGMNESRKRAEVYESLRAATERLKQDLSGRTAEFSLPLAPEKGLGYFEYIEGQGSDQIDYRLGTPHDKTSMTASESLTAFGSDDRLLGDIDDILLFTTRATDTLFAGKLDSKGIESPVAEVVWYCRPIPGSVNPTLYHLCRRQLVVMANPVQLLGQGQTGTFSSPGRPNVEPFTSWSNLLSKTDVACRKQGGFAIPNTLGDLTKRENRFCRQTSFPYAFDQSSDYLSFQSNDLRFGQDVILTNCLGFDVRVLDENVELRSIGDVLVAPGDPGYGVGTPLSSSMPVYVDLNFGNDTTPKSIGTSPWHGSSIFESPGLKVGTLNTNKTLTRTYDTWSTHYETNSLDDDGDGLTDEGHDGIDNNNNGQIDEFAEAETSPPYPTPIRGIEIRVRCYEPYSKQVLQITIRQSL